MRNNRSSFKGFLLGTLIGGAVGAAAVLLYMPQTGKKLRHQLKSKGEKFKKDFDKVLQESQKVANNLKASWDKASQIAAEPETAEDTPAEIKPEEKAGATTKKSKPPSKKLRFFRGI
ncbi:YtxH domain-containing protein [Patescibacteria group bacterium]|nr:YtxH domain-containing protein [Patescibacteria group bacterium]MBU1868677.1 YtxH domain-containing protein [Patescibacteria group bacterium]